MDRLWTVVLAIAFALQILAAWVNHFLVENDTTATYFMVWAVLIYLMLIRHIDKM